MELQPPPLVPGKDYVKWREEVDQWCSVTKILPHRQALVLRSKLSGRVKELALEFDSSVLNKKNGMNILLSTLDNAFKPLHHK